MSFTAPLFPRRACQAWTLALARSHRHVCRLRTTAPFHFLRRVCLVAAALLSIGAAAPLHAQHAPFSRIAIAGGPALNVSRSSFHDHWTSGRGGELVAAVPFYLGEAELGTALHRYETVDSDVPRFDALHAFVGWGLDFSTDATYRWHNGLRIGNYRMTFDEDTYSGVRNESELIVGVVSRVDVPVSPAASLFVAARYSRIFTSPRLDLAYVSGGIRLSFATPRWLQTVLR